MTCAVTHTLIFFSHTLIFFSQLQCRCIYVWVSWARRAAASLTHLAATCLCCGKTGGAACGGRGVVLALGSEERQEPLRGRRRDNWWTFQSVLYSFCYTAGIHSATTLRTMLEVKFSTNTRIRCILSGFRF